MRLRAALLAAAHLVLPVTLSVNFLSCRFDSLDLLATNIFLLSGMAGVSSKALLFVLDRERFELLLLRLQRTRMRFPDNSGARERRRRMATRVYYAQHGSAQLVVLLWVSVPGVTALVSGEGRELPMPLCPPATAADVHLSPCFELIYALQAACLFVAVEGMISLDSSYLTLMLNIATELEVLNDNLVSIRSGRLPEDKKCSQLSDQSPSNPAHEDDMYFQLVENIKHHQHIISRAQELESVMSGPTFVHLFYSLVCISLSIVSVTVLLQTEGYTPKILKITFVIVVFVSQLGFFCILGNNVIEQSERLLVSAYSSYWPGAQPRFQRALLVLMLRARHPLHISVAKLYPLSKETYLQILNASYTLFNLVFQTNGRN
uniref:Odorant receptor n=1 Tax=Locusta migratoria TaxID=7004 RepID=A0A0M4J300_LOCMI|nr:odorant receptor 93 [Locusta migratoria]